MEVNYDILIEALKIYADENQYNENNDKVSPILLDRGSLARDTLKRFNDISVFYEKIEALQDEFRKETNTVKRIEIMNKISELKYI